MAGFQRRPFIHQALRVVRWNVGEFVRRLVLPECWTANAIHQRAKRTRLVRYDAIDISWCWDAGMAHIVIILYNTLFSREENFAKSEFETFSREDIFANTLFTRKYLLAKISSRENIFPRKYPPAKIFSRDFFRAANTVG